MQPNPLKAKLRTKTGSNYCRQLREDGQIPGVIYGHGEAPVSFSVSRHDLEVELSHGERILTLELQGQTQPFLVKDVQYDHLGIDPLHVDLARVDLNEVVEVEVALELRGTPKGTNEGGVLEQVTAELEVRCLAANIPKSIRVNVAHLDVGESLTVADLELPEGVTVITEPDEVVATLRLVAEEAVPEEAEEGESAEPEVITRGKAEEEQQEAEGR